MNMIRTEEATIVISTAVEDVHVLVHVHAPAQEAEEPAVLQKISTEPS